LFLKNNHPKNIQYFKETVLTRRLFLFPSLHLDNSQGQVSYALYDYWRALLFMIDFVDDIKSLDFFTQEGDL